MWRNKNLSKPKLFQGATKLAHNVGSYTQAGILPDKLSTISCLLKSKFPVNEPPKPGLRVADVTASISVTWNNDYYLSIKTVLSKKSLSLSEFVSSCKLSGNESTKLKTCPRMRFQLAKCVNPNVQTLSAITFRVANCVKLKMNVLVEIHSQKAKRCQTEPT